MGSKREIIGVGGGDLSQHTLEWWAAQERTLPPLNTGGELFNQGVLMAREILRRRKAEVRDDDE